MGKAWNLSPAGKAYRARWRKDMAIGRAYKYASKERWRKRNPEKARAHVAVSRAVAEGLMEKLPCELCGTEPVHGHHHNGYENSLDVTWLCLPHHRDVHIVSGGAETQRSTVPYGA